jgi:hypothetical protein
MLGVPENRVFNEQHLTEINLGKASAFIESSGLTSQRKVYFRKIFVIASSTHVRLSVVYGKIDHVFNRTDHQPIKKRARRSPSQV